MDLFSIDNFVTLGFLVLLQAVLGFDNLLYISLESKRAPEESRAFVRKLGIILAVVLRVVLLFLLIKVIAFFQNPLFGVHFSGVVEGVFNVHSLIVLLGGVFLVYTAVKEILYMLQVDDFESEVQDAKSVGWVIFSITVMNVIFSFDSILSAMALSDVFWVMACAIVIGGVLMVWLSDHVSVFLMKNRKYEVLGLFVLLIVGVMLLSEGGHLAHLSFFGHEVTAMSKATFYFVIAVLVLTDVVQGRYQKKLLGGVKE